jgi:hypothetical protein
MDIRHTAEAYGSRIGVVAGAFLAEERYGLVEAGGSHGEADAGEGMRH